MIISILITNKINFKHTKSIKNKVLNEVKMLIDSHKFLEISYIGLTQQSV